VRPGELSFHFGVVCQVVPLVQGSDDRLPNRRRTLPANIMVGAFGEVQVMDWGLAKVLAEGGVADEEWASRQQQPEEGTLIRTARSTGAP
jgi:hypothetical protein